MKTRMRSLIAGLLAFAVAGMFGPGECSAEPSLQVRLEGSQWVDVVTTATQGEPACLELLLQNLGGGDGEVPFDEDDGEVTPHEDYEVTFTVLGAAYGGSDGEGGGYQRCTARLNIGGQIYSPWGDWDDVENNLNDGENPRVWVCPDMFDAEVPISIQSKAWIKEWVRHGNNWYLTWNLRIRVDSTDYPGVRVFILRDGDSFPDVPGYMGQPSAEDFLQDYLDEDGLITLGDSEVIFLFEYTPDLQCSGADFQDLVVLVSLSEAGSEPPPDPPPEGDETTFQFTGPDDNSDWDLTYYRDGEEVSNQFELTLEGGQSEIVQLLVEPIGAPREYLLEDFTLAEVEGEESDQAWLNVVVPGDVVVRREDDLLWAGEDWFAASARPWSGEDLPSNVTRWLSAYDVKVRNVENAQVIYRLTADFDEDASMIARFFVGGEEITDALTSEDGYLTSALAQGDELTVSARVMPVGSDVVLREIGIVGEVYQIVLPDLQLTAMDAKMSPFAVYHDEIPDQIGDTFVLYAKDKLAPGNFGLVDFNGGSNPTPELEDWILNGYDLEVEEGTEYMWLPGDPGWRQTLLDTMQVKIDEQARMLGVIYDDSRGSGNNAEVRMISVVEYVPIEASAQDKQILARYLGTRTLSQFASTVTFDAVNFGVMPKWRVRIGGWEEMHDGTSGSNLQ